MGLLVATVNAIVSGCPVIDCFTRLPAYEWPVQHLQEILRNAWHRRRIHIITNSIALSKDFVDGLTFSEVCSEY